MDFTAVEKNLHAAGYAVSVFDTAAEAVAYLDGAIDGKTVGFGGSVTLQEMGLYEKLASHNQMIWHWQPEEGKTADEMRIAAMGTEVYFSSVNGLAETGEIVNIDGACNRIASIFYGHRKVYLVVGENKLAPDLPGAIFRARNVAAPLNAKRLGSATPCAAKGDKCYDCQSPGRICRGLSLLWCCPTGSEIEVVLIHEALGY